MSRALNETEYIFSLASLKYPDRAFNRMMYRHPITWRQRMEIRRITDEVVAELVYCAEMREKLCLPQRRAHGQG